MSMKEANTLSPACPVCNSTSTYPVLQAEDFTVSEELFTINQCNECTLRFTFPVPDQQHIGAYYQSENYISHTDTSKGMVNKMYHVIRRLSLQRKRNDVIRATKLARGGVLDIGCGTGAFLHTMQKAGWDITGLEPDRQARQIARHKYNVEPLPADSLFRLPAQSFDAITMWHVLEHVHALHAYMKEAGRLLTPKGKFFIAVPNYTSWDAGHYKAYWAAYDVPRHLYHFSPQSMHRLAEAHQFHISGKIIMPYDAFYISLLSEKYQTGKTNYLQGFVNGLHSWLYAKRYPSCGSSIIYILERPSTLTSH